MALSVKSPISIVSYNARGFRSGKAFITELLLDCDVLCLQEHWLLDEHLSDLNVCEDLAPEDRKSKDAVPKPLPVHLSDSAAVVVDMHRTSIVLDGSQCEKSN